MIATLSVLSQGLAYGDSTVNSNPKRRHFDWSRSFPAIQVSNPKSDIREIVPGGSQVIFDGTRATSLASDSAFSVALSTLDSTRYRFTWTGGTNPVFRTDRALTLNGQSVTVVINPNATATMTLGAGSFSGVQVGDTVFLPSVTTGDSASPFNALNIGFWQVLAVISATALQLVRPTGTVFTAAAEVVTLTSDSQLQAFSAQGIQPGDSVQVSAGFSSGTRKLYKVDSITSSWFEVLTSSAIAAETDVIPGVSGLTFFANGKRFVRIESDQDVVIQPNGETGEVLRLTPGIPGDEENVAWLDIGCGTVWSLTIVNKSALIANVTVMSAE